MHASRRVLATLGLMSFALGCGTSREGVGPPKADESSVANASGPEVAVPHASAPLAPTAHEPEAPPPVARPTRPSELPGPAEQALDALLREAQGETQDASAFGPAPRQTAADRVAEPSPSNPYAARVAKARARWHQRKLKSYAFVVNMPGQVRAVDQVQLRVSVRDGQPVRAEGLLYGVTSNVARAPTMEDVLDAAERAASLGPNGKVARFELETDARRGFITQLFADPRTRIADDEVDLSVTCFSERPEGCAARPLTRVQLRRAGRLPVLLSGQRGGIHRSRHRVLSALRRQARGRGEGLSCGGRALERSVWGARAARGGAYTPARAPLLSRICRAVSLAAATFSAHVAGAGTRRLPTHAGRGYDAPVSEPPKKMPHPVHRRAAWRSSWGLCALYGLAACGDSSAATPSGDAATVSDAASTWDGGGAAQDDAGTEDAAVSMDGGPIPDGGSIPDASPTTDGALPPVSQSGLPVAPGAADRPRPDAAGGPALEVLPWAGFKAAASYTFDDSQPSHLTHYDAIAATSAKVTWYLTTGYRDAAPGYDDVFMRALAAGHELGNHTVHHCWADLSGCGGPLASLELEVDQCTQYIEDTLHAPAVLTMAYPFGDTRYRAAASQRFMLARGTRDGMIAPDADEDPFDLPAKAAVGGEAEAAFNGWIDQARGAGSWVILLYHSLLPTDQNWYAGVDIGAVTGSIAHAESLTDVWLGSVADVGAYWLGQRTLAEADERSEGGTTRYGWELPAQFPSGRFVRVTVAGGTLSQNGSALAWDPHGYYEVALDAGELIWTP